MNFTFNIGELSGLLIATLAVGAAFEKLRRHDKSIANLGARVGDLETAVGELTVVEKERLRVNTAAHGIPVRHG